MNNMNDSSSSSNRNDIDVHQYFAEGGGGGSSDLNSLCPEDDSNSPADSAVRDIINGGLDQLRQHSFAVERHQSQRTASSLSSSVTTTGNANANANANAKAQSQSRGYLSHLDPNNNNNNSDDDDDDDDVKLAAATDAVAGNICHEANENPKQLLLLLRRLQETTMEPERNRSALGMGVPTLWHKQKTDPLLLATNSSDQDAPSRTTTAKYQEPTFPAGKRESNKTDGPSPASSPSPSPSPSSSSPVFYKDGRKHRRHRHHPLSSSKDEDDDDDDTLLQDIMGQRRRDSAPDATELVRNVLRDSHLQPGAVHVGGRNQYGISSQTRRPGVDGLVVDHDLLEGPYNSNHFESEQATMKSAEMINAAIVQDEDLEKDFRERLQQDVVDATHVEVATDLSGGFDTAGATTTTTTSTARIPMITMLQKYKLPLPLLVLGVIIVLGIVLGILLSGRKDSEQQIATQAPFDYLYQLVEPLSGTPALSDPTSPQSQALSWLYPDDVETMELNVYDALHETELLQRYVLAVLYFSTGGGEGAWLESFQFLQAVPSCEWGNTSTLLLLLLDDQDQKNDDTDRILCNTRDQIVHVAIERNTMTGTLPSELSGLSALTTLRLSHHPALGGSIPTELGKLSSTMANLDFEANSLTGTIPIELEELQNLKLIRFAENEITGTVPNNLYLRNQIDTVDVSNNALTGTVPDFNTQSTYRMVKLNGNQFIGTIPRSIYINRGIERLDLSDNQLTGTIGQQIIGLDRLDNLNFANNQLDGTLPTELGRLWGLKSIRLNDNLLTGSIPSQLGDLRDVHTILLSNNRLTGTIPSDLGGMDDAVHLSLYSNALRGDVPASLTELTSLERLEIQNNTALTNGLEDSFCLLSNSSTTRIPNITADCGGASPTIPCSCCMLCCIEGDECQY